MMSNLSSLETSLGSLIDNGIEGVRELGVIVNQLDSRIINEVSVLRNDQLELVFNKVNKETSLKTTYSNQLIDDMFLDNMSVIRKEMPVINETLQKLAITGNKGDKWC